MTAELPDQWKRTPHSAFTWNCLLLKLVERWRFTGYAPPALVAAIVLASSAMAQDGPVSVEGVVSSKSFIFQPKYWPNPTVALRAQ